MSLILFDSFDGYTTAEIGNYWTDDIAVSASQIVSSPVHFGSRAMKPGIFGAQKTIPAQSSFIIGFALTPQYAGEILNLRSVSTATGTTTVASIICQADGTIKIRRNIGGVVDPIAKTSPQFAMANNSHYYYIEWTTAINGAALNEIRIDGNLALSTTISMVGTNTTISNVNAFELFASNFFDDLYLIQNDGVGLTAPIGESGIACLFPTADGSFTGWTPNSGTAHFSRVNEIPADGDTSYNSATGAAVIDTYKVSTSVVNNSDSVQAAQIVQLTRDDGTSGTLTLRPFVVVSGGTFGTSGDNFTPAGSYIPAHIKIFEQDPTASIAWTGTSINATEWGIEKV